MEPPTTASGSQSLKLGVVGIILGFTDSPSSLAPELVLGTHPSHGQMSNGGSSPKCTNLELAHPRLCQEGWLYFSA